jgi:hypothetical protein
MPNIEPRCGVQRRDAQCHRQANHSVDPAGRAPFPELPVACGVALYDAVADKHHLQNRLAAVSQLRFKNDALKVAQRRRHRGVSLPEADEPFLDQLLAETGVQQSASGGAVYSERTTRGSAPVSASSIRIESKSPSLGACVLMTSVNGAN